MLTVDEIRLIMNLLGEETVVKPSQDFKFRISKQSFGYSKDENVGRLQAKLSIMLEVAVREAVREG